MTTKLPTPIALHPSEYEIRDTYVLMARINKLHSLEYIAERVREKSSRNTQGASGALRLVAGILFDYIQLSTINISLSRQMKAPDPHVAAPVERRLQITAWSPGFGNIIVTQPSKRGFTVPALPRCMPECPKQLRDEIVELIIEFNRLNTSIGIQITDVLATAFLERLIIEATLPAPPEAPLPYLRVLAWSPHGLIEIAPPPQAALIARRLKNQQRLRRGASRPG